MVILFYTHISKKYTHATLHSLGPQSVARLDAGRHDRIHHSLLPELLAHVLQRRQRQRLIRTATWREDVGLVGVVAALAREHALSCSCSLLVLALSVASQRGRRS